MKFLSSDLQITSDEITLTPKFIAKNEKQFFSGCAELKLNKLEIELINSTNRTPFYIQQFCLCCNKSTYMLVDYLFATKLSNGNEIPCWRERLICPECHMNNRQRLIAKLAQQYIQINQYSSVYLMEQVTPFFRWIKNAFPTLEIIGSEFLGYENQSGKIYDGIRHEDIMNLSFKTGTVNLIISNDVFEHIPNVFRAFQECYRVLAPGGMMLAAIPFHADKAKSIIRAEIQSNEVVHLLPAQYHGDPLSNKGCLVFHDFGWDLINMFTEIGFEEQYCEIYYEDQFGHWGQGQMVFRLVKSK